MKPLTVPTILELDKAAVTQNATAYYHGRAVVVNRRHAPVDLGGDAMTVYTTATRFHYRADVPQSKREARYLAGEHIAALKRMQEAGL